MKQFNDSRRSNDKEIDDETQSSTSEVGPRQNQCETEIRKKWSLKY